MKNPQLGQSKPGIFYCAKLGSSSYGFGLFGLQGYPSINDMLCKFKEVERGHLWVGGSKDVGKQFLQTAIGMLLAIIGHTYQSCNGQTFPQLFRKIDAFALACFAAAFCTSVIFLSVV